MIQHNLLIDLHTLRTAVMRLGLIDNQEVLAVKVDPKEDSKPIVRVLRGSEDWKQETKEGYQVSSRHGVTVIWRVE